MEHEVNKVNDEGVKVREDKKNEAQAEEMEEESLDEQKYKRKRKYRWQQDEGENKIYMNEIPFGSQTLYLKLLFITQ